MDKQSQKELDQELDEMNIKVAKKVNELLDSEDCNNAVITAAINMLKLHKRIVEPLPPEPGDPSTIIFEADALE